MPVGVRFREAGRVYYFDAGGLELDVGNYVVVETPHGQEVGRVVVAPDQVIASEIKESLKPVLRRAEPEDMRRSREMKERAQCCLPAARETVQAHGLDMRVVSGDYDLEGSQLTLYFTADERVDFRALVKDLSSRFESRVQLLQVGERDRAKLVDGIGRCGERLCCSSWLTAFPTVSIKMAKEQELPLNPGKISGVCGRLLCCLTYEYEAYRELRGTLPRVGTVVSTPAGEAKVASINVPRETVTLRLMESGASYEMPAAELRLQYGTVVRPAKLEEAVEEPVRVAAEEAAVEPAAVGEEPRPWAGAAEEPGPGRRRRRRGRRGGRRSGHRGSGPSSQPSSGQSG